MIRPAALDAVTRPATVASILQKLIGERRVEHAPGGGYRLASDEGRTPQAVLIGEPHYDDALPRSVTGSNP